MYTESDIKKFFIKEDVQDARTPEGVIFPQYLYTYKFPENVITKTGLDMGDEITIHMNKKNSDAAAKEAYKEYLRVLVL